MICPSCGYRMRWKTCLACNVKTRPEVEGADMTSPPDKRVPAELWRRVSHVLRSRLHSEDLAHHLEACPDIVDEPATLDPTAQAVLDAVDDWDGKSFPDQIDDACAEWVGAGRPTVEEDPTLAALRECRELGLGYGYSPTQMNSFHVCGYPDGGPSEGGKYILRRGDTLPEALAAYKAAQAPQVEYSDMQLLDYIDNEDVTFELKHYDDWHWWECEGHKGKTPREAISAAMRTHTIGPECPPTPKGEGV